MDSAKISFEVECLTRRERHSQANLQPTLTVYLDQLTQRTWTVTCTTVELLDVPLESNGTKLPVRLTKTQLR